MGRKHFRHGAAEPAQAEDHSEPPGIPLGEHSPPVAMLEGEGLPVSGTSQRGLCPSALGTGQRLWPSTAWKSLLPLPVPRAGKSLETPHAPASPYPAHSTANPTGLGRAQGAPGTQLRKDKAKQGQVQRAALHQACPSPALLTTPGWAEVQAPGTGCRNISDTTRSPCWRPGAGDVTGCHHRGSLPLSGS